MSVTTLAKSAMILVVASLLGPLPAVAQGHKEPATGGGDAGRATAVTVVNRTRVQIDRVRISPSSENDWGNDLLGDDVIAAGARRSVRYSGACNADVQVVFHNESMEARRRIDVCSIGAIAIEPGWTLSPSLTPAGR